MMRGLLLCVLLAGCNAATAQEPADENYMMADNDEMSEAEAIADNMEMTADNFEAADPSSEEAVDTSWVDRMTKGYRPQPITVRPNAPSRDVFMVLSGGLRPFKGKPQQYAFKHLGYPDRKMTVGRDLVYIWANTTSNTDGGVLTCTVKVIARVGRIVTTDFNGNAGACNTYASRFGDTDIR